MKNCICDKCEGEIQINIQEEIIDKDTNGRNIVEQFFICPNCGARYTIIIIDSYMEKRIAARKRLKTALFYDSAKDTKLVKEMQNHLKKLKIKYGRE